MLLLIALVVVVVFPKLRLGLPKGSGDRVSQDVGQTSAAGPATCQTMSNVLILRAGRTGRAIGITED